jgi:hypothetical protein
MEGVTVAAKNLRHPNTTVKVEPAGITISTRDERDPQMWVMVYITTGALWGIINQEDDGAEFFLPPVPPLLADEIDLGNPPPVPPLVTLPPVPRFSGLPPVPPKG